MDFSSSRLSQSWLSSRLYLSCVTLSDSVILLIDYQWTQVAAEVNTVFRLFSVGNSEKRSAEGLAVTGFYHCQVTRTWVSNEMPPCPFNTAQIGSQRGNILFIPMETHFRSKDLFDYVSCYMTNVIKTVKNKPQEAVAKITGGPARKVG